MRSILDKRGVFEVEQLQMVVITLVVIGIILGLGLIVLGEFRQESCVDDSWNATSGECDTPGHGTTGIADAIDSVSDIGGWLSLIVLVVIIGIILAIVFRVLPGARTETVMPGY